MKIKIKDEMTNIKIKCSHRELWLLTTAVSMLSDTDISNNTTVLNKLNSLLFDNQELDNTLELEQEVQSMLTTLMDSIVGIDVY